MVCVCVCVCVDCVEPLNSSDHFARIAGRNCDEPLGFRIIRSLAGSESYDSLAFVVHVPLEEAQVAFAVHQDAATLDAGVICQLDGDGGGGGGGFVGCVLHVTKLTQNPCLTTRFPVFFSVSTHLSSRTRTHIPTHTRATQ